MTDETNPKDALGIKKPPLNLNPASALIHMSMAMANGAKKYGEFNWRKKKVKASIYIAAAERHMKEWYDSRVENADDSCVHHLGHAMACFAIILDAQETGNLVDDRPEPGATAALIKRLTDV